MSFLTHTSENVLWMSSSLLDGSGVRHGFSTRVGGVSPAPWDSLNLGVGRGDDMDRVREITAGSAPPWGWMSTGRC